MTGLPEVLEDANGVHAAHCCAKHGCQYGYKETTERKCPVAVGVKDPTYPNNNGCEQCEWELEEFPEMANFEYTRDVLDLFAKLDITEDLIWHVRGGMINFSVMCSDTFMWGGADAESLRPEDLKLFRTCVSDLREISSEAVARYATILFSARKRGMRPMRLWLERLRRGDYHTPDRRSPDEIAKWNELYAKDHALIHAHFLACGPERDPRSEG